MRIVLFTLMLVSLSWTGMAQNRKAAKYNDKIINEQHKISPLLVKFYKSLNTASLEELKAEKAALIKTIDASIAKVFAMPGFEGDVALRDACLDWFKLYKRTLEVDFEEVLHIVADKDKSADEKAQLQTVKEKMVKEEDEIDAKFETVQTAFAQRHGLQLVEHPIK